MAGKTTPPEERLDASGLRVAVVTARFNHEITEALADGALRFLKEHRAPDPEVVWVPGAFELPLACHELARGRRVAPVEALVALGCVVRGETPHFDFVAGECARGLMRVQLDTGVPVGFGVLTTETRAQAEARAGGALGNKGSDAAMAAVEMALILRRMR